VNEIFQEDCLHTMRERKLPYDYVFFSPPEYDELGLEPVKQDKEYFGWLRDVLSSLDPQKNLGTIVISDRRHKRKTIPKHARCLEIMEGLGWELLSQKIWEKSSRVSLYRINYAFVMTFGRGQFNSRNVKSFLPDVWVHPHKSFNGYSYNMPREVVAKCLQNYTKKGDTVYDPFMGSGTTALACVELGRNYLGSEIDGKTFKLAQKRLGIL